MSHVFNSTVTVSIEQFTYEKSNLLEFNNHIVIKLSDIKKSESKYEVGSETYNHIFQQNEK